MERQDIGSNLVMPDILLNLKALIFRTGIIIVSVPSDRVDPIQEAQGSARQSMGPPSTTVLFVMSIVILSLIAIVVSKCPVT